MAVSNHNRAARPAASFLSATELARIQRRASRTRESIFARANPAFYNRAAVRRHLDLDATLGSDDAVVASNG
jgi:hypothetical protein